MSARAIVALGSNIDPERHLPAAVASLERVGKLLAVSRAYASAAVGEGTYPSFLNAAVVLETKYAPGEVLERLRALEAELGRVRSADRNAPRTIDLDLVAYGDGVVEVAGRRLPAEDVRRHAFIAVPVAEVAGAQVHPTDGRTYAEIAAALDHPGGPVVRNDVDLLADRSRP